MIDTIFYSPKTRFAVIFQLSLVAVFSLFGLGFSLVAEWLFWDEFGVRFNFIAVDYLVYRREATDNIFQSYPVFWILPLILIISSMFFSSCGLFC